MDVPAGHAFCRLCRYPEPHAPATCLSAGAVADWRPPPTILATLAILRPTLAPRSEPVRYEERRAVREEDVETKGAHVHNCATSLLVPKWRNHYPNDDNAFLTRLFSPRGLKDCPRCRTRYEKDGGCNHSALPHRSSLFIKGPHRGVF